MFSTREQLAKRTGQYGIGRFSYLQSLVTEFQDTTSEVAKIQVLANLANFAYDPVNYDYFRQFNIIDLFLDCTSEPNDKMVEFAVGGLCNLCLDRTNKEYILENDGVKLISSCLASSCEETVLSSITCLMFLVTPSSKEEITCVKILDAILRFSKSSNPRLSNLANIFLQDYCTKEQIQEVESLQDKWEENIQTQAQQSLADMHDKHTKI